MKTTNLKKSFIYQIIPYIAIFFLISACQQIPENTHGWFDFAINDLDSSQNAVDLSFLNEDVAGESGYITVQDGQFINGKGEQVRFFGDNVTFDDCFPDKETASRVAARLAKMGCNVVRFHHMDMRSSPAGIWDESMENFDPEQVDKLDWFIYQLKNHGIYTNLNMHVSRTYPKVDYDLNAFNFGKAIDNFYPEYIRMQKEFARRLLTHENPYTGTTYTEEPAVAFVEVNNENSLLSNWALLPQLEGDHKTELARQWRRWLGTNPEYGQRSDVEKDLYLIIATYEDEASDMEKEMLWSFLIETEMSYFEEMIAYIKKDLGTRALISGTQASYSGIAGVLREARYAEFIDMHAYWEHPRFPGQSWSSTNWLIRNSSMVADDNAGTLDRFGHHSVEGMPLTISEYDHPAPNFFVAEMYPMLNSVAAFHNWDGIYHFTFNGPYNEGKIDGFFSSAGHPLKQVYLPVGAVMFRMGAVKPGEKIIQLNIPEKAVVEELVTTDQRLRLHGSNMEDVWEKAGAPDAITLMHPIEVKFGGDEIKLSEKVVAPDGPWVSETGELTWDNRDSTEAVFTVNAPAAKAAIGYIGGKEIVLDKVTIAMDTTPYNWASIAMASLDGKPLEESSIVLLVAGGRAENTDMGWNEEKTSVGRDWGKAPTLVEGVPADIRLSDMDPFVMYKLDSAGNQVEEIPVFNQQGHQLIKIGARHETLWYVLRRED